MWVEIILNLTRAINAEYDREIQEKINMEVVLSFSEAE